MPNAVNGSIASRYRRRLRAAIGGAAIGGVTLGRLTIGSATLGCVTLLGAVGLSVKPVHAAPSTDSRAPSLAAPLLAAPSLAAPSLAAPSLAAPSLAAPAPPASSAAPAGDPGQQSWAKAFAQGQWSAAIELLETIPEGSRTAWHWLHLARAFERRTQLVEAFAAYERVHDLAAEGVNGAGLREVERQAKGESKALAARIPWAEVRLGRALPLGSLVFIDQQWLEPTRLRSPYPVNPGWHTFLVESNGEVLAARRAFFEEGQTRLVPLMRLDDVSTPQGRRAVDRFGLEYDPATESLSGASLGAASTNGEVASVESVGVDVVYGSSLHRNAARRSLTRPSLAKRVASPINAGSLTWRPVAERRADADRTADDSGGLLRASYVSLGAGALGTLVGTGFLISALNTRMGGGERANCFSSQCEQRALADTERTNRTWRARTTAATFSYAVGLAGLVTGGVLWLLHRESSSRAATINIADLSLELAPRFSPHGATIRGTF